MPTLAAACRRILAQRGRKCLDTLGTQLAHSWRMSIDTFQTRPESTDGPTRSKACEGELEEFLRQAVGEDSDEPLSLREWLDLAEAWKITRTLRACGGHLLAGWYVEMRVPVRGHLSNAGTTVPILWTAAGVCVGTSSWG